MFPFVICSTTKDPQRIFSPGSEERYCPLVQHGRSRLFNVARRFQSALMSIGMRSLGRIPAELSGFPVAEYRARVHSARRAISERPFGIRLRQAKNTSRLLE
jgi:hypothetical protein